MTVFTPPYAPSYSSQVNREYRTLETEFGDGYAQVVKDGLNNVKQTWELSWANINDTDAATILSQLDSFAGTAFQWLTPENQTKWFTCKKVNRSFTGFQNGTLTMTFAEFTQ